ncbi:tetratricopeptide repeat protein [Streptomyces antimycoticus]
MQTLLAWLTPKAGARPCRWLIVLDDVADPDDLRGLWPPASPYGRTLVTTRRRDAALTGEGRRRIEIGLFTEAEALEYLSSALAAHGRHEAEDQLTALASDLGCLPLALAQATAYLIDADVTVADYRSLLADRTVTLADATPDRLPDDQALPLAAAWTLSIDHADTLRPTGLARPMLQLAALLDPNGIPQDLLTSEPIRAHLAQHRGEAAEDPGRVQESALFRSPRQVWRDLADRFRRWVDEEPERISPTDVVHVLRVLHRLSLIHHTPATPHQAVRVHQLIQRASREALTPKAYEQFAQTAAAALTDAWPDDDRDTSLDEALRANATALIRAAEDVLYGRDLHQVFFRAGERLGHSGQFAAARDYYQGLVTRARLCLEPDHRDTFQLRRRLAYWRGRAGDATGAAAELDQLLDELRQMFGSHHYEVHTTVRAAAYWRGRAGDAAGAIAGYESGLPDVEIRRDLLYSDDAVARLNTTYWRRRAEEGAVVDAASVVEQFEQRLAGTERVLGADHPDTLAVREHLARWRGRAGDGAGAVAEFEQLVIDMGRVLGADHPDTLAVREDLVRWRGH